jgi:hypothetical protein
MYSKLWYTALASFSLKKNLKSLICVEAPIDDVSCLHGIRAMNAIALLLSHKCMQLLYYSFVNRTQMSEVCLIVSKLKDGCPLGRFSVTLQTDEERFSLQALTSNYVYVGNVISRTLCCIVYLLYVNMEVFSMRTRYTPRTQSRVRMRFATKPKTVLLSFRYLY